MTPAERTAQAKVAAATRHHPDSPNTQELAAQFKADRLAEHIKKIVDTAPILTLEQRDRLAVLLRGSVR